MGGFGTGHVWLTPDGGTTWLNRSSGLPDVPFNAIMIDPVRPSVIYAACDYGVYVSHNKGVTWFDFNTGFPGTVLVMDLQPTADNKIVAATHGRGVYRSDLFTPPQTLPVKINSFTGVNKGTNNELKWSVEQEIDLSRYVVERSLDGSNFVPVATINAANSTASIQYVHLDPVPGLSGNFYYRLKAYNRDETYMYSDIVLIKTNKKIQFTVIGNPFHDQVTVKYTATGSGNLSLQIFDLLGRVVKKEKKEIQAGIGTHTIYGLENLKPGMYIIDIWFNRERFTEKLLKK